LEKPTKEEIGSCDKVDVKEIGSDKIIIFDQKEKSKVNTIIIRGATKSIIDEVERAIDDGVNTYKILTRDPRLLAGAGATEIELHRETTKLAEKTDSLDQYAIRKFAESFLIIPRTLSETCGFTASTVISNLNKQHENGEKTWGIDIEDENGKDSVKENLFDCYLAKYYAISLAVQSVINILSVDQIIMSRPSGGPKAPNQRGPNENEDD